jgi:hypothetical protein
MPQALPLPDGRFVTIREGETPAQTWERAQRMYPEAFASREPEKKETTIGGQAKEFFKGLAPGAINLVESAAVGASALLPEETEKAARSGIASLASSAKKPFEASAGYEDTVGRKFGEAAGSIIPFLGLGPLGVAGRVGMGALGAGAGAGEARTRAEAGGATEGERAGATALGTVVGISEMFAPARILGRVAEPIKDGAVSYVKRALMAGGEEAAQEAASQAAQNLISKGIYKPDQAIIEGVGESAAYGGAVGALAQGLFDMALGRRAKGSTPQQDEFATLRAEEEKRLEAERQRKTTPEYAQEVVQQYDTLAQQKQALIAQIKKIEKESPTADADRAFNKDLNLQIKEVSKELEPLAEDYYKSKNMLAQVAEQERVAKLTPQEYAFGVAPETVEEKAQAEEQGPEYYEQQIATPPAPPEELTPREMAAQYANQRIALANDQMNTAASFNPKYKSEAANDYVGYLMQDPELAQQVLETRTPLTGLPKGLSNADVLDALKLKVKPLMDAKKKAELETFQTEMGVRKQALGTTKTVEDEDQSVAALRDWMDASQDKFQPNTDSDFNYLNGMFESAFKGQPQPIAVNDNLKPLREAPTVRKAVESLLDTAEQANKEHWMFRRQGNRAAAIEALQRRSAAMDQLNAMSAEKPAGVDTKGLKRGPTEEDTRTSYARELITARRGQQEAMAKLEDATSSVRSEQTLGRDVTASNTEEGLVKRANDAQAQFIRNALQEAAIHRRAAGKPALTTDEALKAASKLHDTFNNWISRAQEKGAAPEYEDVIVEPAQMRADKIVRPAVTERRLVSGGVKKLSEAEVKHFKAIAESVRNKLAEEVPTTAQRVETGPLKRQFAAQEATKVAEAKGETATTLGGQLRRRKEYTNNLLDKALTRRDVPENIRDALERARNMIEDGVADTRLLDAAENQATRVLRGQDLGLVTRMGREQIDAGRQVVRNVPGKEGSTEIGRRGQKFVTTGTQEKAAQEKAAFPKGAPVAVEANESLRELEEAMSLNKRVAQEQAGQKSLFPEAEEDLGYIRATPANFAKSPRIKPVWEAIDRARELFKKTEPVRLAKEATRKNRLKLLNQLEERMDSIRKDTQFFWKDTSRWTDAEMAKVFAGMPEAGTTQAEKDILYKYSKAQKLTPQEQAIAEKLLRDFRSVELPKYQARVKEAMDLLAQGRRLQDADNQLLSFMQDTNANVRAAAKALNERMAGMRDTVKYLKDVMRGSAILSPEQKALLESEKAVEQQRGTYQQAVEKAITKATADMNAARAALLDPQIGAVSKELEAAKKTLDKEQAEMDKIKKRFDSVLAQKEGANRTELATYELFRYEEKKGVIDDLKEKVKTQEEALDKLVTERHEEFDGATVVIQAMLDNNVKFERQYLEMQEANLAAMRGESVLDNPNAYPFAYRQAEKNLQVQKQTVKAAEKRATEFKEVVKSDQQQMEEFWKDKLGGEGVKREEGKVERLQSTADKEAARLREEAIAALDKEERAAERAAIKAAQVESLDAEVAGLITELGAYEDFPNELSALKKMAEDESLPQAERDAALAKAGVVQNITSLEAQREVLLEGKPRKKQKASTAPSTSAMAAQKPLRTGYRKTLEAASEGMRAERESGVYGEFSNDPFMASDYDSVTASLTATLRDDFDNLFMESTKAPVFYKNQRTFMTAGPEGRVAFRVEEYAERSRASTFEKRIEMALKRMELDSKARIELFEGDPEYRDMYKEAKENLEAVRKMSVSDFTDTYYPPITRKTAADKVRVEIPVRMPARKPTTAPKNLYTEADYTSDAVAKELGTEFVTDAPFHGMTFADAAKYGAKRTSSPQVSELFMRLADVFESSPAEGGEGRVYAVDGLMRDRAAGLYNTRLNVVYTRAPSRFNSNANKILLHELTHAATSRALNDSPDLRARVNELRKKTVDWLETKEGKAYFRQHGFGLARTRQSIYALKNEHEFIAEVFANRDFQKLLTEIPSDKPRKSIFTRFVEIMSKYFDMPAKAAQSLFAESVALTEEILAYTKAELYENNKPIQDLKSESLAYQEPVYNEDFARVGKTIGKTVAQDRSWMDSIKANTTGLAFETQLVDRFAGFERLAKYMEPLKGTQMLYYLRSYDQRMNIVSKAVSDGAPAIREVTRKDDRVERLIETTGGASIAGVVNKLKDARQYIGNGEAVNQAFTTYMAAIRAKNKGIETLNFGTDKDGKPVLTQAMLDEVTALVENNKPLEKIFNEARTEYNKYNRDLLDFVASTGALSKVLVKKLVAEDDYIPFYRQRKGVVELVIGNESSIRIGSIAEQPYLDKLIGGDTAILDFMNSSVQNTNMLVDMGMRNLATKNAVMELVDLKAATLVKKADGSDVVKFKVDGDDRYAIIATEKVMIGNKEFETGVPADLLVKGMEGIPTQMPFLFRVMAMPAQVLRKAVTLSPLYMAKQLFRDSLAAPIVSGANFTPVIGALRELNGTAKEKLEKRGIVGGQYFRGTSEDLSMILREISDGQPGWMKALGRFEAMGMEADALTRRAQYNSYIEQGLSEMEATLMALESMNFNKRGASPSVHVANALIPFFNAQIQGLNVLYKAMSGKMPFNDQLRIREKMLTRGGMMAAATFAYAAMMEDDEAYKNATPDQKYGNWFIRLPGLDEPIKVPVPFEIGYIFKAIPEALYNSMTTEHGGEEAVKAFKQILLQTIPGGSSYGIPQAAKPLIEVGLGKSFYTGRDILSAREKQLLPEEQYRVNTSEAAKLVGSTLGVSPIKIEALVSGYTGTMGLAFLQALSLGVPTNETPERAVRRLSEYPIVGGAFQPNDAGGIINSVYERMNEVSQVKSTVDKLLGEGKVREAEALMTKRGTEYMQAELANTFKTNMNMLTQAERAIAASSMSPEEKRKQLDEIRKMKTALANTTREISDKTIRLVGGS